MKRRIISLVAGTMMAAGLLAGPALADGGVVPVPVLVGCPSGFDGAFLLDGSESKEDRNGNSQVCIRFVGERTIVIDDNGRLL